MPRVPRTITELQQELRDQLELLKLDVAHYDEGVEIAAKSIAGKLRLLLHDTARSISLLQQLGTKNTTLFHDTAHDRPEPTNPDTVFVYSGLINIRIGSSGADYVPHLEDMLPSSNRQVPFASWWNGIVFLDTEGESFTRKDLVLALANQDGGAHVDPHLEDKYYKLSRENFLNWQKPAGDGTWTALRNPHYAAVRQIAHELMRSLVPSYTAPPSRNNQLGVLLAGLRVEFTPSPPTAPEVPIKKVGRNDPCPCGSGKKFKKCHGGN